jgi:hypothetical protein
VMLVQLSRTGTPPLQQHADTDHQDQKGEERESRRAPEWHARC